MPTTNDINFTKAQMAKKWGVDPSAVQYNPANDSYTANAQKPVFGGVGSFFHDFGHGLGYVVPGMDRAMAPGASIGDILKPALFGGLEAGTAGFGAASAAAGAGLGAGGSALAGSLGGEGAAGGAGGAASGIGNFLKNYVTGKPLGIGAGGIKGALTLAARLGIPAAAVYGMFGRKKGAGAGATDPSSAASATMQQNAQNLLTYAALASSFMNPYEQQIRKAYQTQASAIRRLMPQLPSQFRGVAGLMEADMMGQSQAIPGMLGQQAAGLPMELLQQAQTNPLSALGLPQGSTGTVNIPGMGQVKLPGT